MHILQITSGGDVNGAIMHCAQLSRELVGRGQRVTLVCPRHAWIAGQLAPLGVECIASDMRRWPLDELRRIGELAAARGVDVLHTHQSRAHSFGVLLRYRTGIPCVASAHNRYVQLHWRFNDFVIGTSAATTRFHRRWNLVPQRRIETIHYFIDEQRAAVAAPDARARLRAAWDIADDHVLVGQIGNVIPRKGLLFLVQALPRILAQKPNVRLAVVGDPKNSDDYVRQVRGEADRLGVAGAIRWLGQRSDVADVLAALDVVVLASLEESFPLSVLEAMTAGLPVVATAVGGLPECVHDGQNGFLVPPAQPQPLAAALLQVVGDAHYRGILGQAGQRLVRERYSVATVLPRIEAVYQRVCHRRRRKAA